MTAYRYSTKITENCAKAVGVSLPISLKKGTMVCQAVRGMNVQKAKKLLEDAINLKKAIPFTRYNHNVAHKAGMAGGRFAVKTCEEILDLLKSAEANAQFKGLSTGNLIIRHASTQKGPTTQRYGRKRTKTKRAHVEFVLEEVKK
ncbi:MAG: 50S ribosomal protein L22 [Candidatus Woesearchaeota archaeon]|nr:50S ribosomal protein L22 [Candidatus Woesearchaeota archaeon]